MEKSKALAKLDELIKTGNDLLQNKEYYDVNSNSQYTGVLVLSTTASGYRVDEKIFNQWQEEIRLFLSYEKFKTSYAEFNKERKNVTNATKTEEYIAILNSLRKGIFDDFIELKKDIELSEITNYSVFIGHGHNLLWARIGLYLSDRLQLKPKYFEDSNRTSKIIPSEIEKFVNDESIKIAIFTLMKEDETINGKHLPRQNVIDEAARFYTKLGREKVILVIEKGVEYPSNLQGVLYIEYSDDEEAVLLKIKEKLEKEKII